MSGMERERGCMNNELGTKCSCQAFSFFTPLGKDILNVLAKSLPTPWQRHLRLKLAFLQMFLPSKSERKPNVYVIANVYIYLANGKDFGCWGCYEDILI